MIVPEITIEDIFEIYDLMELFQKYAVRRSMKRMNELSLKALENTLYKIREALDQEKILDAIKWDIKFHEFLVDFAESERLKQFYELISVQIGRFLSSTLEDTTLAERSYLDTSPKFFPLITITSPGEPTGGTIASISGTGLFFKPTITTIEMAMAATAKKQATLT